MEWREDGTVLGVRPHGENAAILEVFTASRGRHFGVVRGGSGRRLSPLLQQGAQLDLTWRARLEDHIGSFTVEPREARAARLMADRAALAALSSACGLLSFCLPERDPHPDLYRITQRLLGTLGVTPDWPVDYLNWELALLEDMGFGLDLTECAATGTREGLSYVSPRTGRAVSAAAAGAWASRLLPLPPCLLGRPDSVPGLVSGLSTTGYFLEHRLAPQMGEKPLPSARARLVDALRKLG